ncbi:MAG TPA: DUF2851 family protein [Ktedonobacterales bacterium]
MLPHDARDPHARVLLASATSNAPSASSAVPLFCSPSPRPPRSSAPSAFAVAPSIRLREREAAYAARWAAGDWRGATLATAAGDVYTVVYEGRRGGPAGPDFRDAVLLDGRGEHVCGDVELHLRASGWRQHGHDHDPRYAGVLLHLVVHPPREPETTGSPLPGGRRVPIALIGAPPAAASSPLPCAGYTARIGPRAMREMLASAGDARFEQRVAGLRAAIQAEMTRTGRWDTPNRALAVALAEALGYGRDRALLRATGERLIRGTAQSGMRGDDLPLVERARLRGLDALFARWRAHGPWDVLRARLVAGTPRTAGEELAQALAVPGGDVSRGRALILTANVVLPFAAAAEPALTERARVVYATLPGLPSNAITRLMSRQLGLPRLPAGARAQQGLHHLWATVCREKRCVECPCAL